MTVKPNYAICQPGIWTPAWTGSTLFLGGRIPLWIQLSPGTSPGTYAIAWRLYASEPPFFWTATISGRPRTGPRPPNTSIPANAVLSPVGPATYAELWLNCPVRLDVAT